MTTATIDHEAIVALVGAYAERLDAGDLDGVAGLFDRGSFRSGRDGAVRHGRDDVRRMYDPVLLYDDGTPRTKHVLGNIEVTVDGDTAASWCVFTVFECAPDQALQAVLAGRYHDRFARTDGRWHFEERVVHPDLIGDLSRHMGRAAHVNLTFDLAVEGIVERLPRPQPGAVVCIGVAGPVAAGKSAMAQALAAALPRGLRVEVLSTDGFLFPNAELVHRGLLGHKGYPDTYDATALRRVVADLRRRGSLLVPEYSHETYDVVPDARVAGPCDVLVVEGLHALTHLRDLLDVSVFVDADVRLLEEWYVERFQKLRAEARDDPSSFYASMAEMSDDDADSLARQVWNDINLPNCVQHVALERTFASIVVVKGPEHCVLGVEVRSDPSGGHA